MERFFKTYFWTVELAFIALIAFLSASTVNGIVGGALRAVPSAGPATPSAGSSTPKANRDSNRVDLMNAVNPFHSVLAPEDAVVAPPPSEAEVDAALETETDDAGCPSTSLRLRLVGIIYSPTDDRASTVTLVDQGTQDTYVAGVHHFIKEQNAQVSSIKSDRVFFRHNNRTECIKWGEDKPPKEAPPVPVAKKEEKKKEEEPPPEEGIAQVDDSNYVIAQKEIDDTLSNLSKVATQARVIPNFSNGKADGFKFYSIKPNSIYQKIGLKSGDVVHKINGYEMNSPDKALEVWTKLREARAITIELSRASKPLTLNYTIR